MSPAISPQGTADAAYFAQARALLARTDRGIKPDPLPLARKARLLTVLNRDIFVPLQELSAPHLDYVLKALREPLAPHTSAGAALLTEHLGPSRAHEVRRLVHLGDHLLAQADALPLAVPRRPESFTPTADSAGMAAKLFVRCALNKLERSWGAQLSLPSVDRLSASYTKNLLRAYGQPLRPRLGAKYALLARQDPVRPTPVGNPLIPSNILLANTHFETRPGAPSTERAAARSALDRLVAHLCAPCSPVSHVMRAAAALFVREKGHILVPGGGPTQVGIARFVAASRRCPSDRTGAAFYNCRHTVVVASVRTVARAPGNAHNELVHELQHMLFQHLVGYRSSPVYLLEDERRLDKALADDKSHRAGARGGRTPVVDLMYAEFETDLMHPAYFDGRFDPANLSHQHIMRVEAIVRPMALMAQHGDLEAVRGVAPNLLAFYDAYCRPLFAAYVAETEAMGLLAAEPSEPTRPLDH